MLIACMYICTYVCTSYCLIQETFRIQTKKSQQQKQRYKNIFFYIFLIDQLSSPGVNHCFYDNDDKNEVTMN